MRSSLIYLLYPPSAARAQLKNCLVQQGYQVNIFDSPEQLTAQHISHSPCCALLSAWLPSTLALNWQDLWQAPPSFILFSDQEDLNSRLQALRSGVALVLPAVPDPDSLLSSLAALLNTATAYRVLVVDDDDLQLQIFSYLLKRAGLEVRTLQQPLEFLTAYQEFQPDVVLLDMHMPQATGLELAKILNSQLGIARSSIIFLSAETDPETQLAALAAGAEDYIVKPPQPEELVARVRLRAQTARRLKQMHQHLEQRRLTYQRLSQDREREHEAINRHAIVSVADPQGRITYVNQRFCHISGYQEQELLGQNHRILKSTRHSADFYHAMWSQIRSGQVWQGEVCNQRRDGNEYWVESTIIPFFDDEGRIKEYVSIRTDITRLKEIECQLKDAEQQQRQLAWERGERVKESLCLANIMRLLANEALTQEQVFQQLVKLIPQGWQYPEHTSAYLTFAQSDDTSPAFCATAQQMSSSRTWVDLNGNTQSLQLLIALDAAAITAQPPFLAQEYKLLDQILDQLIQTLGRRQDRVALIAAKKEADQANKAKSNFLSSMSHELRTPMNAILGFAQMLEADDALDEDQRDSAHEITRAGRHLLSLINEVLDLAKVEAGKISISLEQVAISEVVDEVLALLTPLAQQKKIQLHGLQEGSEPVSWTVQADRVRLKQVLLNLGSNAIKYNHPEGEVWFEALSQDNEIQIQVRDTGYGISTADLAKLGQPFQRLEAESTSVEGTGIGLTISRKLVQLMQGTSGVTSQLGAGSTFWLRLPKAQKPSATQQMDSLKDEPATSSAHALNTPVQRSVLAQPHILSIDDNPANLKLVEQLLKKRGYQVTSAPGASLGLELALACQPDLVLMDINMPEMDGFALFSVFQTHAQLKSIPVIAVSANAQPRDMQRGLDAGFSAYLTKPLHPQQLYSTINAYLPQESPCL
ncbi:response regulator [Marinospirillum sp. MEB164]|uniref:histidine kinase n=1 Tax=Marinospirillum alkalitolerans TaxID=3123374 RepID=A0ABW8PXL3_9GAMM